MPFFTQLKKQNVTASICIVIASFFWLSCSKTKSLEMDGEKITSIFVDKIDRDIAEIIHHTYNWQFEKAMKDIEQLRKKSSDTHTADALAIGTAFWQYLAVTTPETNEIAKEQYNTVCSQIKERIDADLKANPENLKAIALLGVMEGSQAKFFAIEAEWYKAYRYGVKGYANLKKVEKENPHDYDIHFGIGLYKYYCATLLPKWFQKLSWMVPGIDVDREGGYERLHASSKFALLLKTEALLAIGQGDSGYEQNYEAGVDVLEKLSTKYPNNKIFRYVYSAGLYHYALHLRYANQAKESVKYFKKIHQVLPTSPTFRMHLKRKNHLTPQKRWTLDAHSDFELGYVVYKELSRTLLYMGHVDEAQKYLEEGASCEHFPLTLRAALYFQAGLQSKLVKNDEAGDEYFKKAMNLAPTNGDVHRYSREMIGANLPPEDFRFYEWNKKAIAGQARVEDILREIRLLPPDKSEYRFAYYEILFQLYKLSGDKKNSEKYNDLVRFHSQVER